MASRRCGTKLRGDKVITKSKPRPLGLLDIPPRKKPPKRKGIGSDG